jgi:SAM-dependent methyltransferase
MAITETAARLFIRARLSGVNFDRTLVVGRQLLAVSPLQLRRLLKSAGLTDVSMSDWLSELGQWPSYSEPFFRALGARELVSLDNSDYEQADLILDLNQPIPDDLQGRYDLVVDGGSLEHVFDFLQALRNLMNMVTPGGHLILMQAANDMCGHGFYQFSPELFFRALSEENGFRVEDMVMVENDSVSRRLLRLFPYTVELRGRAFQVQDPALVGQRIEVSSGGSTMLFVVARKVASKELFSTPPQQSDYSALWERGTDSGPRAPGRVGALSPRRRSGRVALGAGLHVSFSLLPRMLGPLGWIVQERHRRTKRFTHGHPGLTPLDLGPRRKLTRLRSPPNQVN